MRGTRKRPGPPARSAGDRVAWNGTRRRPAATDGESAAAAPLSSDEQGTRNGPIVAPGAASAQHGAPGGERRASGATRRSGCDVRRAPTSPPGNDTADCAPGMKEGRLRPPSNRPGCSPQHPGRCRRGPKTHAERAGLNGIVTSHPPGRRHGAGCRGVVCRYGAGPRYGDGPTGARPRAHPGSTHRRGHRPGRDARPAGASVRAHGRRAAGLHARDGARRMGRCPDPAVRPADRQAGTSLARAPTRHRRASARHARRVAVVARRAGGGAGLPPCAGGVPTASRAE